VEVFVIAIVIAGQGLPGGLAYSWLGFSSRKHVTARPPALLGPRHSLGQGGAGAQLREGGAGQEAAAGSRRVAAEWGGTIVHGADTAGRGRPAGAPAMAG
jgi:hypothetical protein